MSRKYRRTLPMTPENQTRCRLCGRNASGEYCEVCAGRLNVRQRVCQWCQRVFWVQGTEWRRAFCSVDCAKHDRPEKRIRAASGGLYMRLSDEEHGIEGDLTPAEIEARIDAEFQRIRQTRQFTVESVYLHRGYDYSRDL